MSTLSVLYDAPGPKAKKRNIYYSIIFGVAVIAVIAWILMELSSKAELAPSKWKPFLRADLWSNILLPALLSTLKAAGLSLIIALPIGAILALGRMSDHGWIRWPSAVIVEFFRAIPVLLLMVFAKVLLNTAQIGSDENRPLIAVVIGLVLYNSSVLAEVFRSGVFSLPKGQTEASMSIGLRKGQMMRLILLPQALAAMLPAIVSQLVVIVKDTALGGQLTIQYSELLRSARTVTGNYSNVVATYVVIAAIFIIINFALTSFASWLERKLRQRRGGSRGDKGKIDPVMSGLPVAPLPGGGTV